MQTTEGPAAEDRGEEPRVTGDGGAPKILPADELARWEPEPLPEEEMIDPTLTGWQRFAVGSRRTLREAFDYRVIRRSPYGFRPIVFLILLGAVGGFGGQVFGLASPDIIRDLDLDLVPLFRLFGIVNFLAIFLTLLFGYIGDRKSRKWMLGLGTIVSGASSILVSRMSSLGSLGGAQVVGSLGGTASGTPQTSLLSDWYPARAYARMISLLRLAFSAVAVTSFFIVRWLIKTTSADPAHPNWRFPVLAAGVGVMVIGVLAFVLLKDPIRGYIERREQGVDDQLARIPRTPPSFGEAWRTIWGIRTLRRLFISSMISSPADTAIGIAVFLFLFEKYGLNLEERAMISVWTFLPTIPAAILAGGIADVIIRRRPGRALLFSGMISIVGSLFIPWLLTVPPLWVVVGQGMVFFTASALLSPITGSLLLNILPAHTRTLGTAVQALAQIPGAILYFAVVTQLIGRLGVEGAILASFPLYLVAGFVQMSAAGFFARDLEARKAAAVADEEWRRAKLEGRGKLLVCRSVDVEYDGVQVLFGVDFDVEEGELIALLGTNGAGKSTLLKAIAGSQEASGGAIVFDGENVTHIPPHELVMRGMVLMPGGRGIFPGLSVRENLMLGGWMVDEKEVKGRLEEVYRIFPVLKERGGARAVTLSGGEQQMLSLAQVFLNRPRLLMIDELSLGLSPAVVQQLIEIVRRIHQQGTTIILVEQSVNVALTVAERAIFMEKGEVKFVGKTRDLLNRPDILRAVYVKGTGALTEAPVGGLKTAREMRRFELEGARNILEVGAVSKSFGGIAAVRGASFGLREGEILGLIGPNGAGKTTLFDLISGYLLPDGGKIVFDGMDVTNLGPDQRAKRRLVRRFQDARLFPSLTVFENVLVALERKLEVRSFALTALQVPQVRQAERRVRRRAERLVELLELSAYRDKFVKELSTGLRRITDLACVLASEPKLLLLDEPSTGIAQAEAEMLAPLLRRVRFETGCTMLIIEHDMPLISSISDQLLAMDQGVVVTRGIPEDVLNDERVIESYLGTTEETIRRQGVIA